MTDENKQPGASGKGTRPLFDRSFSFERRQAGPLPSSDISENVHFEEPLDPRAHPTHGSSTVKRPETQRAFSAPESVSKKSGQDTNNKNYNEAPKLEDHPKPVETSKTIEDPRYDSVSQPVDASKANQSPNTPESSDRESRSRMFSLFSYTSNAVSNAVGTVFHDVGASIAGVYSRAGETVQDDGHGPYDSPATVAPSDTDPLAMAELGALKEKQVKEQGGGGAG